MTIYFLCDILVKYFALQYINSLLEGDIQMFEKNLELGYLLDFYGELLSERKRSVMDMYYNEDLSLAEISAEIGITRQGTRDIIKKTEEELLFFEEKLGLAKKLRDASLIISELENLAFEQELSQQFKSKLSELIEVMEK